MPHTIPEFTIADVEAQPIIDVDSFTTDDAVDLGLIAVAVIREWDLSLAVDIVVRGDLVFRAKLGATDVGNDVWLAGKAAVVRNFNEPSLLVRLRHEAAGTPFADLDYDHDVMKAHGGSIPIRVNGDVIGTITTSGEPDVVDHEAASEAVRRYVAR